MKTYSSLLIIITLIFCFSNKGFCDFRMFHDTSGRAIEAKLINYEPRTKTVKVELKNETVKSVKASIFSTADQSYIQGWYTLDSFVCKMHEDFLKKDTVKVPFDPRKRDVWQPTEMIFQDVIYNLELRNSSGNSFKNVNVEYCIQYESKVRESKNFRGNGGWYGNPNTPFQTTTNALSGTWLISEFIGTQKQTQKTKVLRLKDGLASNLDSDGKIKHSKETKDKLIGICLRLSTTLESGDTIRKEICSSNDLAGKVQWATESRE